MFLGRGFVPTGHCGLLKGHDGFPENCAILVESKPQCEEAQVPLDIDLTDERDPCDAWKPGRDIPG